MADVKMPFKHDMCMYESEVKRTREREWKRERESEKERYKEQERNN